MDWQASLEQAALSVTTSPVRSWFMYIIGMQCVDATVPLTQASGSEIHIGQRLHLTWECDARTMRQANARLTPSSQECRHLASWGRSSSRITGYDTGAV